MTDIAIPTERGAVATYQQSSIERLERWADQAIAVRKMADAIVNTSFCPQGYRDKPDEATAAILAGAELGFDPMASLRAFDSIQGTPAPKAITLRAVVQRAGHDVVVEESTEDRAIVAVRRKGSDTWQKSVWTMERAAAMGLTGKPQWKQQRSAMLVARATSEGCRWVASDAIMGMPYSAEEISDTTGLQATAPTRRVTAADIVGQALAHPPAATTEQPTIDVIDRAEALARIRDADTQDGLDAIRDMCQAAGLRDQDVKEAWAARSAEIADAAR